MADNTIIQQPSIPGDIVATEDIGGVKFPVSKIVIGDHGIDDGTVSATNPLPVVGEVEVTASALPVGAATAAKQPALGTAGTPSIDVLTVQGHASMTPFKVEMSGSGTQPISGSVSVTNFPATQPVSVATLPLPTGAASAAKQPALGTPGSAATDVITVQGHASMTPVKIDGSATTQPISGNVAVNNFPVSQSVSGTVSVSNFPATQPVSAASLPLPAGAATSAKQAALGTPGTPSTDVLTIQGHASMTAIKVDASASTQPVSGSVSVTNFPATQPVSAVSLPLPAGAATSAKQPALGVAGTPSTDVLTVQGHAGMTAFKVDGSATTQPVSAASLPLPSGAATSAKQPALGTPGTSSTDVITVQGHASMTALKVDGSAVTQPVSGSVSVSNFPATQPISGSVSVSNLPATQPVSGSVSVSNFPATQPVSAVSLPLPTGAATSAKQPALGTAGTPATDVLTVQGHASMTAFKVDGSATTQPISAGSLPLPTGAATAAKQPALGTAGSPSADVITVQGSSSGTAIPVSAAPIPSIYMNVDLSNTGQVVKSSAGTLCGYFIYNNSSSTRFVKIYNKATAATFSDTPVIVLAIPGGSAANAFINKTVTFSTGISVRATVNVAVNDDTSTSTNDVVINLFYT